jgi:hypothetical protein
MNIDKFQSWYDQLEPSDMRELYADEKGNGEDVDLEEFEAD